MPDKKGVTPTNKKRQLAQWGVILGYLFIIYAMGAKYWGVTNVAEFVTIFIILSFLVLIAYRALEPKENKQ